MSENSVEDYKQRVIKRLAALDEIFASASIGDFSKDVEIPDNEDEFTSLYAGVQVMLEVIREKIKNLNEDKEELEVLINNLPVGVYIAEVQSGKPILANKKAKELVGENIDLISDSSEFIKTYGVVTPKGEAYPVEEYPIYITTETGEPAEKDDIELKRKDGTTIVLNVESVPVFNEDNDLISVLAVFDDVTKERELEKLKLEFVSLASHQLRTPLGTMRWNLEMLLNGDRGGLSDEIRDALQSVYEDNRKMLDLVNNLLNLARLEQGQVLDNPKTTDITEVIDKSVTQIQSMADERSITINMHIDNENKIIPILIDPSILAEVLLNLLSNAVKYNKDNGSIDIYVKSEDDSIEIKIKDSGIGIKKEDFNNIFKKFYRTREASKKDANGSGLGLFVVKEYIEAWGGTINFESEYNVGTTFVIKLPLKPNKLGVANVDQT